MARSASRVATSCSRSTSRAPSRCVDRHPDASARTALAALARGPGGAPARREERIPRRSPPASRSGARKRREGRRIADAVVVNDDMERAVTQVAGILERYRTPMANRPGGDPPGGSRWHDAVLRSWTHLSRSLLDKVDSKFTLVALSSKRARQINSYYNQLGESLGVIVPPQVTSVSGKPLTIAFEEIATSKTTYHRPDPTTSCESGESASRSGVTECRGVGLEPGELTLGGVAAGGRTTIPAGVPMRSELSEAGEPPDPAS